MVFKMTWCICRINGRVASFQLGSRGSGATYFSTSRIPKTTPSSTRSGTGSRDDAQPLYWQGSGPVPENLILIEGGLPRNFLAPGLYEIHTCVWWEYVWVLLSSFFCCLSTPKPQPPDANSLIWYFPLTLPTHTLFIALIVLKWLKHQKTREYTCTARLRKGLGKSNSLFYWRFNIKVIL
jgi:hypothetical protein